MSRIVVVSNSLTYMSRFRRELLETIAGHGHDVLLLCPSDRYASTSRLLDVAHREIPLAQHGMNPLAELRALLAIVLELKRSNPDLVINFTIKPALYGSLAAAWTGVRRRVSVFTGLGYWFTDTGRNRRTTLTGRLVRRLLAVALARNDLVFFQNPDDRDMFVDEGLVDRDVTRISDGSGVDTSFFSPRDVTPDPDSFLMIARLLEEKGVREFAAAARQLKRLYPQARFRLLGGIDTSRSAIRRDELHEWIDAGIIEYMGEVSDVREYLARASVLVLPSYREGTPRSVLEGLAMGKAVVTSDAPGCRETVRDGVNGYLVPPRAIEPLAVAMQRLIGQPDLVTSFGQASRRLAVERYDLRRVNESFLRQLGLS